MMPNRGLIIRQPWIDLILCGKKTWEMRSKPTKVRGRIALIESGTGLITGEAYLTDSLDPVTQIESGMFYSEHRISEAHLLERWRFPWVLENVKRYENPIPYFHPKGAVIWVNFRTTESSK